MDDIIIIADSSITKKLIDLIERYDLDKYDNLVLKRKNKTYRVKKELLNKKFNFKKKTKVKLLI